jgi:hypothetical protein
LSLRAQAFLRNVYMLDAFGTMGVSASASAGAPYVQLLSLTNDSTAAHNEFVKVREPSGSSGSGSGSGSKNGGESMRAGSMGVALLVCALSLAVAAL